MRRTFVVFFIIFATLPFSLAQNPIPEPLRTAGERPIDIQHIRLDLRVDLSKKTIDGKATLQLRSLQPISTIALDGVDFEVKGVTLAAEDKDSAPVRFTNNGRKLLIDLPAAWPAGKAGTLRVDYRVRNPKDGLNFFGPSEAAPDVPLMMWSQGEALSNRYWFPCLDQPNQRQTTEVVATVPDGFDAISNGKLIETKPNADKTTTFHWKQEKPHAAYLVALTVGRFDVVREEWKGVPVLYYVPKGRKDDVERTFRRTPDMIAFFSKRFGIDYPWEKYAQVVVEQFSHGGMENTGATTLTHKVLHDERALLDSSPNDLIAHELAHQWWGDLITCRDWSHLWLNEGFATYSEGLWIEHDKGADELAYLMFHKAHGALVGGKDRPIVDRRYPHAEAMFDGRSYSKGSWVLHMLRRRVGEEQFWASIRRYGNEHRLKCVETSDLRRAFEQETGRDLERFFYDWTERPGHPILEVASDYLPEAKQARIVVKQTQKSEAFHFPLTIVLRCPQSKPVVIEQEITGKDQTITVPLPGRPDLIEIDPNHALLAEIKESKGRDLWLAQLKDGSGVVSRIRAAQHLGQSKTPTDCEALAKALPSEKFWGVQVEIAAALGAAGGEVCRDALIQGLKHTLPKVRRACADQLGKFRGDAAAIAALKELIQKGDASYFVEAAALGAYAKLRPTDAIAVLLPHLAKTSHAEVIRTAVLRALGNSQDLAALDTLLLWTARGKPPECRVAALTALGKFARNASLKEDQQRRILTTLSACLEGETARILRAAVTALRELGQTATPALATLEAIQQHDPDEQVRELAKKTVEQIRASTAAPGELPRFRDELARLKKENDALRERLDKLEKKGPDGP